MYKSVQLHERRNKEANNTQTYTYQNIKINRHIQITYTIIKLTK